MLSKKGAASFFKTFKEHRFPILKKMWIQAIIALFLGIGVGILLGPDVSLVSSTVSSEIVEWLALPGNIFLGLIKMIIIPLIFSSIILGIISSGSPEFLRKIGPKVAIYFVCTTSIAVGIGWLVSTLIHPGSYFTPSVDAVEPTVSDTGFGSLPQQISNLVPSNPFSSVVQGDMLAVVIIAILLAVAILAAKKVNQVTDFLQTLQDICLVIIKWSMRIMPLAVFGLIAKVFASLGFEAIAGVAMYMLTVVVGLIVLFFVYLFIVAVFARKNPWHFWRSIAPTQLIAFSTSSSAATLPSSMRTAEEKLGAKHEVSEFILPVGATINMDGTALYQIVATIFLAQAFQVDLTVSTLLMVAAIAVGASIGAPATPGAGIIVLTTILQMVGIPMVGLAIILGVDRILDMLRTSVNVTGDLTATVVFDKYFKKLFEK